ncbi:VOC family protein [Abyssibius alkaniclasticus]|uniref:VOC family protein n=1 Tax=Abyssibius alkaniclasticus TaxID=2881234 RepID=UPI00405A29C8
MAHVIGLGGLFLHSPDPDALRTWYHRVLGLEFENWGGVALPATRAAEQPGAASVFSLFGGESDNAAAADKGFMFNLMVDDLVGILARCAEQGVLPVHREDMDGIGLFAHIIDPDGRKVELWEPVAAS